MRPRIRQPLGARLSTVADVAARALALLLGAALVWYGLMAALLAAKVDPGTVDAISAYRTAYDWLAGLGPEDVDGDVRWIAALAGLVVFVVCGWLALRLIPRPYVARRELSLERDAHGTTEVAPRALERLAEAAAHARDDVAGAAARWGDHRLAVDVTARSPRDVPAVLREVRGDVREALDRHGVPVVPVDVTLAGIETRPQRRELS